MILAVHLPGGWERWPEVGVCLRELRIDVGDLVRPPWRGMGDPRVASPIIYKAQRRLGLWHSSGAVRTSQNSVKAKFAEQSFWDVRLIGARRCRPWGLLANI